MLFETHEERFVPAMFRRWTNPFWRHEATLGAAIRRQDGNAVTLPCADDSFDVVLRQHRLRRLPDCAASCARRVAHWLPGHGPC